MLLFVLTGGLTGSYSKGRAQVLLLLFRKVFGSDHIYCDKLISPVSPASQNGYTLFLETEHCAGLRALGDSVFDLAVDSGDLNLIAKGCLSKGEGHVVENRAALTAENLMGTNAHGEKQVASGPTVSARVAQTLENYCLVVVDSGGYVGRDRALAAHHAGAPAFGAGLVDYLSCAAALGTGAGAGDNAKGGPLLLAHCAGALAVWA